MRSIDAAAKTVQTDSGPLTYDYLVIALGARTGYFGRNEWENHAPGLKTLDEATALRRQMLLAYERAETTHDEAERTRLLSFVIVGGGPTGVEMAGALAELARRVLVDDFRRIDPTRATADHGVLSESLRTFLVADASGSTSTCAPEARRRSTSGPSSPRTTTAVTSSASAGSSRERAISPPDSFAV